MFAEVLFLRLTQQIFHKNRVREGPVRKGCLWGELGKVSRDHPPPPPSDTTAAQRSKYGHTVSQIHLFLVFTLLNTGSLNFSKVKTDCRLPFSSSTVISLLYVQMVFTVTSSNSKIKITRSFEFLPTPG